MTLISGFTPLHLNLHLDIYHFCVIQHFMINEILWHIFEDIILLPAIKVVAKLKVIVELDERRNGRLVL